MQRMRLPLVFALISAGLPSAMISPRLMTATRSASVGLLKVVRGEQNGLVPLHHAPGLVPQHSPTLYVETDRGLV